MQEPSDHVCKLYITNASMTSILPEIYNADGELNA